jgi:hypothetical protein
MPMVTIVFGSLLLILGVVSFVATGSSHPTALIPAGFGIVFEILGVLALRPNLRKHAMHAAALLAVLGFAGTVSGVMPAISYLQGASVERAPAAVAKAFMAVFVALSVRSFVAARMAREG